MVSELISDKPLMHRCHTIERHDVYECLILNVAVKEELDLLEKYIVLSFEQTKNNEVR
jgi:hypothetical protein